MGPLLITQGRDGPTTPSKAPRRSVPSLSYWSPMIIFLSTRCSFSTTSRGTSFLSTLTHLLQTQIAQRTTAVECQLRFALLCISDLNIFVKFLSCFHLRPFQCRVPYWPLLFPVPRLKIHCKVSWFVKSSESIIFCWGQRKCNFMCAGLKCNRFWCIIRNANSHSCEPALVTVETNFKNWECCPVSFFNVNSQHAIVMVSIV